MDGNETVLIWVVIQCTTFYIIRALIGTKKNCASNDKNKGENKLFYGPYSLAGHDVSSGET